MISCATAHLESEFFEKRYTQKKIKQLEQVRDQLVLHMSESDNKYRQQLAFYMGDTNLTGAEELQRENAGIAQLGFTDMWKVVRGDMFDHTEQQSSKSFCAQDCTWCAPENPTILKLQAIEFEHHRPDRLLFLHPTLVPTGIKMDIIRETWSGPLWSVGRVSTIENVQQQQQ